MAGRITRSTLSMCLNQFITLLNGRCVIIATIGMFSIVIIVLWTLVCNEFEIATTTTGLDMTYRSLLEISAIVYCGSILLLLSALLCH